MFHFIVALPLSYARIYEFMGRAVGFEPTLSYVDSRQTLIVVLTSFERKNATRLRVLSFAFVLTRLIHHSR